MPRNSLGHRISHLQYWRGAWNDFLGFHGIAQSVRGEIDGTPIWKEEVYSRFLTCFIESGQSPEEFAHSREIQSSLPEGYYTRELAKWLRKNGPKD